MQGFGPFVATAGSVTQVSIPPNSDRVRVGNDTPYDVLLSFAVAQPQVASRTGGDWQEVVPAWSHPTISLPNAAYSVTVNGMGGFNGSVWLLPLDTGGLASTGTLSNRRNLWVTAYAPGEVAADMASVPRQHDISSQNRVVSVPLVPLCDTNLKTYAAATNENIGGLQQLSQANISNFGVNCYLYGLQAGAYAGVAALLGVGVQVVALLVDSGGAALGPSVQLFRATIWTGLNNAAPFNAAQAALGWQSPYPLMKILNTQVANAFGVQFQLQWLGPSAVPFTGWWNIAFAIDTLNASFPKAIGAGPAFQTPSNANDPKQY